MFRIPNRFELVTKNDRFKTSFGFVILIVLMGVVGPYFVKSPFAYTEHLFEPPSLVHKLGTDAFGRDIWAQLVYGTRNSLIVGVIAGLLGLVIAFLIGGIGGYLGGLLDESLNLVSNVFLTIPLIPFLIVLSVLFKHRSLYLVAFVIAIILWPGTARAIRSEVLSLKERNFIDLAKISGKNDMEILSFEIFPNMLAYVFIQFCTILGTAIVLEAGISLLGLGPTGVVTLGGMLHWAIMKHALQQGAWWWLVPPGFIVILLTGSMIMIGSVIDDALNPKLRGVL